MTFLALRLFVVFNFIPFFRTLKDEINFQKRSFRVLIRKFILHQINSKILKSNPKLLKVFLLSHDKNKYNFLNIILIFIILTFT